MSQSVITLAPGQFLGELPGFRFETGIYHKTVTGIGATESELRAKRHSILVFPSRSIAWTKSLTNPDFMYVGSKGAKKVVSTQEILKYDQNSSIQFKKILVVANSLPKVFEALGSDHVYGKYFLFFDEIDKFQNESVFRSELEGCIDYYLDPRCQGCLVTATLQEFSNPALSQKRIQEIRVEPMTRPPLKVLLFNNINDVSIRLNELVSSQPNEKIVIAHKSVRQILKILRTLDKGNRQQCGILCGSNSREEAGKYYVEFENNGLLPRRVLFMTAAYFSGIDIVDNFTLYVISDRSTPFSILTRDEMVQVFGRARNGLNEAVLLVEEDIFGHVMKNPDRNLPQRATQLKKASNTFLKEVRGVTGFDAEKVEQLTSAILEQTSNKIQLVRLTAAGELTESYFTIDQYQNRIRQLGALYSTSRSFKRHLMERFEVSSLARETPRPSNVGELAEEYISLLSDTLELPDAESKVEKKIKVRAGKVKQFFTDSSEMKRFLSSTYQLTDLSFTKEWYKLMFLSLRSDHPFRQIIESKIKVGEVYSGKQMNAVVQSAWKTCTMSDNFPLSGQELLSVYFDLSDRTSVSIPGVGKKQGWRIQGVANPAYKVYSQLQDLILIMTAD